MPDGAEVFAEDVKAVATGRDARVASEPRELEVRRKAASASAPPAGSWTKTAALAGSTDRAPPGKDVLAGFDDMMDTAFEVTEIREDIPREGAAQATPRVTTSLPRDMAGRGSLRSVAELVAERAAAMRDGDVELRLSPKELGNLRISFSSGDASLIVTIHADRPETLDLFRRNIAQFTQDLAEMGYENVSMSFAEKRDGETEFSREPHHSKSAGQADDKAPDDVIDVRRADISNAVSGLDLRL